MEGGKKNRMGLIFISEWLDISGFRWIIWWFQNGFVWPTFVLHGESVLLHLSSYSLAYNFFLSFLVFVESLEIWFHCGHGPIIKLLMFEIDASHLSQLWWFVINSQLRVARYPSVVYYKLFSTFTLLWCRLIV